MIVLVFWYINSSFLEIWSVVSQEVFSLSDKAVRLLNSTLSHTIAQCIDFGWSVILIENLTIFLALVISVSGLCPGHNQALIITVVHLAIVLTTSFALHWLVLLILESATTYNAAFNSVWSTVAAAWTMRDIKTLVQKQSAGRLYYNSVLSMRQLGYYIYFLFGNTMETPFSEHDCQGLFLGKIIIIR